MGFIYIVENKVNGKKYVGQTTRTVKIRWTEHTCSKNRLLSKAIKENGKEMFTFIKIEECEDALLDKKEKEYIQTYTSLHPYGYNIDEGENNILNNINSSKGGKSILGHEKQSAKVKEKYKKLPELTGLSVPQGISFKKNKYKEKIQYVFIVRKKGIKNKFFSSMNVENIPLLLEKSKKYLNDELTKLS